MNEHDTIVRQHPFFNGLTDEQICSALELIPRSEHVRGEFLFYAGDVADFVFLLFEGVVKKSYVSPGGDEKIISIIQSGDIFGELFLGKYTLRIASAEVILNAKVGRITKKNLLLLYQRFPHISMNLIGHLADEQRETLARLHSLMHIDARHRLLGMLLSLARRSCCPGNEWYAIPAGITQDDLANIACLNRTTVSLYINELRTQGILGGKGRVLTVNRLAVEQLLRRSGIEILE